MTAQLPVGVIGLGRMGQIYSRHLARQIPNARLIHVSDVIQERAQSLAQQLGVAAWSRDHHDILNNPAVEAVFVTSPTSTHREIVIAAAEAGKAVFCEKPMALTLEDSEQMLATIDRTGTMFQAGFMRRFDAGYVAAQKRIQAGEIGKPVTLNRSAEIRFALTSNMPGQVLAVV